MTDQAMSPLRRRMIEDMTIRKFASKTRRDYLQRVKNFTAYLGRSPDTASSEDLRRYQIHLTASGVGTLASCGFAHFTDDILQCRERSPLDAILQSARTMQQIMNACVHERRLRIYLKCLNQHAAIAGLAHGT